jgi:uncharacterized protein with HEPN domain
MSGQKIITILKDILDNIYQIEKLTKNLAYDNFIDDDETYLATVECIERIANAGMSVPTIVRAKYSLIPWSKIAAVRQIVNKANLGTDPVKVWEVATDYLQVLKPQLEQMIKEYSQ